LNVLKNSVAQYRALGHAAVLGARRGSAALDRSLRRLPWHRKIEVATTRFASLPAILQHPDLVATMWRPAAINFCRNAENLKMMNLPFHAAATLVQHWHARYQNDQKNRWIRTLVKSLFREEADMVISNLAHTATGA
jgi:hypothetical protein